MFFLFPPILLLLISLTIFIFHLRRLRPAISWLVGFVGVMTAWILVLVLRFRIPSTFSLPAWQPSEFLSFSPQFILDNISWPYAVSITTLALVGMMVSLVNQASLAPGSDGWKEWALLTAIAGTSLLAVFPADFISLIVIWTALDLVECCFWIGSGNTSQPGARPVIYLASRLAGTFLVVWVVVVSQANNFPLSLHQVHSSLLPVLFIGLGIRTGVLPLNLLPAQAVSSNEPRGALLALVPQAASLMLASRIAPLSSPGDLPLWLLFLSVFTVFSSIAWSSGSAPQRVKGYWLATISGLALATGSQFSAAASLAWGNALLLAGGLLMIATRKVKLIHALLVLGAFSLSSLPYSLTWQGVGLYGRPISTSDGIFLISHLFLLVGYLRFSWHERQGIPTTEPWKPALYFTALLLLPMMILAIYFLNPLLSGSDMQPTLAQSWPAILIVILCLGGGIVSKRFKFNSTRVERIINTIAAVDWHHRLGNWLYRIFGQLFSMFNFVLEGQAGVLWAFLIFILLVSLMAQFGAGG